ncbi:MAG: helix-turn-helix domain-containing protein [Luteitalea sp.]|nr:helix-turn-helix domain-containing protein [Luteitalea sp.]
MNRTFRLTSLFFRRLHELGLPRELLFARAGLPTELLGQDPVAVTTQQLFELWRAIGDSSDNPAIGLEIGTEQRIERYDPVAMTGLYARFFGDALTRLARYKQLTCPEEVQIVPDGDACIVQFGWPLATQAEPPVLVDVCFAWVLTIGRRGTATSLSPRRVELRHQTTHREMYEAYFQCAVHAGASRNALIFDTVDLDRPFVTHNPELLRLLTPHLDAELSQYVDARSTSDRVKAVLKQLLVGQRPAMRDVARDLAVSPRTLQRRLNDEGVSFQQLLLDARRELARHYLLQPSLELNEAAYLLGYGDPNSFFRAFHHWEGTSPGQWRAVHMEAPRIEASAPSRAEA